MPDADGLHLDYLLVPLRRRDGTLCAHAIIDRTDARLAEQRWSLFPIGYVGRSTHAPRRALYLHREVLGLVHGDGLQGDHIDGNALDCRRSNLRVVTHAQNGQNQKPRGGTSAHRGVYWNRQIRKWVANGRDHGKTRYLGSFEDELEAAAVARAWRDATMTHNNEDRAA
jgi:HNH endonuclease